MKQESHDFSRGSVNREDNGLNPSKVLVVTEEIEKVLETLKRRKGGK